MPTSIAYAALLEALAAQAGLDAAELRAQQEIVIDGVVIVLSATDAALECVCEVATLAREPAPAQWRWLLQANTLGPATRGAALGLLGSRYALVLGQRVPLDAPAAEVLRSCRDLAAAALAWKALLPAAEQGGPLPP
ncbi:type III secretion system chaperone [Comamonas antarctica]|uniref:type III secretion system chaperone n=1 Tax=Comamonas antarctica TaxID=2743470 RepID=UPI0028ECFF60|nr:type III secretion system chaperone [Comamonas antarctica]